MFAQGYRQLGQAEQAQAMLRSVLELRPKLRGAANLDLATCLHDLAAYATSRGDLVEAKTLYREAAEVAKGVSNGVNPEALDALSQLALTLIHLNDLEGAEAVLWDALDILRKLPTNDPAVSRIGQTTRAYSIEVFRKRAELSGQRGEWKDVLKLQTKVLALTRNVNGPEHPDTFVAMDRLATCYEQLNRKPEAEALRRELTELKAKAENDQRGTDQPSVTPTKP